MEFSEGPLLSLQRVHLLHDGVFRRTWLSMQALTLIVTQPAVQQQHDEFLVELPLLIWWGASANLDGFLPNTLLRLSWALTKTVTPLCIYGQILVKTIQSFCSTFPLFLKVCPIHCYIDTGKAFSSYHIANKRQIFVPFNNYDNYLVSVTQHLVMCV
jgi:hypothetical protein